MKMTHNGKIGRLPKDVQEQLNRLQFDDINSPNQSREFYRLSQ
jgi:hypothetical protein